jgi:hypothetical protein
MDMSIPISEGHAKTFTEGSLFLPINGGVSHFGMLGEKRAVEQRFAGTLECGRRGFNMMRYEMHMNPSDAPEHKYQNPDAN